MKICSKCKIEKDLSEFCINNQAKDKLNYYCKKCSNKQNKKWREYNPEYEKKYYKNNKEQILEQHKQWREENIEIRKKWYKDNKEHLKNYRKKSYQNNKEYFKKYQKENYQENKEQILKKAKLYHIKNKEIKNKKHKEWNNSKANYNTFVSQISWTKDPVRNIDSFLQTKCTYCGKWHFPTNSSIGNRISALNNNDNNYEGRLYCSNECKEACSIYNQKLYPKGFRKSSSREVQPELRQLVFKRDNYTCLKCKKHQDDLDVPLHCHHIEGILWNPLESADIDQCMTVCKDCHKEIHKQTDCRYVDMQCK